MSPSFLEEAAYGVAEQCQSIALGGQSLARPARMLRGEDMAFGMRHQAEYPTRRIAKPGHVALRTVGVERIFGWPAIRIDIAKDHLPCLFETLQQPFLAAEETPFSVRRG